MLLRRMKDNKAVIEKLKKGWIERVFGAWEPSKESGVEYVRKIRREWKERGILKKQELKSLNHTEECLT